MNTQPLIDIRDLSVGFASRAGHMLPVLRNIDFQIRRGETVGLVGESGSGKSTLALAAMGYLKTGLKVMGGQVNFGAQELFSLTRPALERLRGAIGMYIGSKTPPEIAVSVMAEILAVKNGVALPRDMGVARAKAELAVMANDPGVLVCGVPSSKG